MLVSNSVSKKRAVILYSCDTYAAKTKFYISPYNSSKVETCPQQASVRAYLKFTGDLWTNSHLQ